MPFEDTFSVQIRRYPYKVSSFPRRFLAVYVIWPTKGFVQKDWRVFSKLALRVREAAPRRSRSASGRRQAELLVPAPAEEEGAALRTRRAPQTAPNGLQTTRRVLRPASCVALAPWGSSSAQVLRPRQVTSGTSPPPRALSLCPRPHQQPVSASPSIRPSRQRRQCPASSPG